MANLGDKQLLPKIFVGGIGLILLGIGIGGAASLPSTVSTVAFPPMGPMMGSNMMGMMTGFAAPMGPFGTSATTSLNAYLAVMIGIYVGLIAIGSYLIYRAVAPVIRLSVSTNA